MDFWKIAKWLLIAIAIWWAWDWIRNQFATADTGSSEVYTAPYAGPLQTAYPIYGWSPYWYARGGRRGPGGPRRGRRF